ncbi:MAG: NADH-quinone oxidoreductase subunit A [Candidatus Omnitrophota bacterium]
MLLSYFGVLVMFVLAVGTSIAFLLISEKLGPKRPNAAKNMPFETGKAPFEAPAGRHAIKFYLVGMLFVIFDIELIFLYPWAVVFREIGWAAFIDMMIFLFIFEVGFLYAWRKGAFQWK